MLEYIYMRNNPRGRHYEFWHHEGGCRRWLVVERDTEKAMKFTASQTPASRVLMVNSRGEAKHEPN